MSDELTIRMVLEHPALEGPRDWLRRYRSHGPGEGMPGPLMEALREVKRGAVRTGDQLLAKAVWCLESIDQVQTSYLAALARMESGRYYEGWCLLERADIALHFLDRHFREEGSAFGLEFVRRQVEQFEAAYPYRHFLSPEILEEARCSVCEARITPRTDCGHRLGEIYDGEMCARLIRPLSIPSVSIVRNPVQKYSVVFPRDPATGGSGDPNPDAYPVVRYVVERLASPWDGWNGRWMTERHPHEHYADVQPTDPCPCISPTGTYAECCLSTDGVLRPHFRVGFEVPPAETPLTVYA